MGNGHHHNAAQKYRASTRLILKECPANLTGDMEHHVGSLTPWKPQQNTWYVGERLYACVFVCANRSGSKVASKVETKKKEVTAFANPCVELSMMCVT